MSNKCDLYGWDVSPFTAKVRAYFKYKAIPFNYKKPSGLALYRKIQPAVGKMIMPVVFEKNGTALQDSTVIVEHYEAQHKGPSILPEEPKLKLASMIIELFSDEWLPMASLHYRWNYPGNHDFIFSEFGRDALPYFPRLVQKAVAKKIGLKMAGYLPVLGITDKTKPQLEIVVERLLDLLNQHFKSHRFLLGGSPTLGDFSLYGQLYAHLHRDPEPVNLIAKYSDLLRWLNEMHGDFRSVSDNSVSDEMPETLLPIIELMIQNQFPLIRQTIDALSSWANEKNPADKVPQRLGNAKLQLNGVEETRFNLTYPYWMFQRTQDAYFDLTEEERKSTSSLLQSLNIQDLFEQKLEHRTELKRSRLYLVK